MANVAANLKPGGYFIATGPDGKRVAGKLKDTDAFEGSLLKLYRAWEVQHMAWGAHLLIMRCAWRLAGRGCFGVELHGTRAYRVFSGGSRSETAVQIGMVCAA